MGTKFRGTKTYPLRHQRTLDGIKPFIRGKSQLFVVDIGPGLAWKRTAKLLPPGGKVRKGIVGMRDIAIKYADTIARRFARSGKNLVTFEPFEIAKTVQEALGKNAQFNITVIDNKPQTGIALQNNRAYAELSDKVRFIESDIQNTRIPENSDLVFATAVLPYTKRDVSIRNLVAGLKKGGILITDKMTKQEIKQYGLTLVKEYGTTAVYSKN